MALTTTSIKMPLISLSLLVLQLLQPWRRTFSFSTPLALISRTASTSILTTKVHRFLYDQSRGRAVNPPSTNCVETNADETNFYPEQTKQNRATDAASSSINPSNTIINRRGMIATVGSTTALSTLVAMIDTPSLATATTANDVDDIPPVEECQPMVQVVPLEFVPTLGAYVVRYTLFGEEFAAVVDTGSPFLTVPSYCKPFRNQKMRWGCYRPELTQDSGYANTIEGFDNNYGLVVWRKADFSFPEHGAGDDKRKTILPEEQAWAVAGAAKDENQNKDTVVPKSVPVVFGVLGKDLLNGSGGVFFGLIKETDRWIRPSFLGQMGYTSFCVDLRHDSSANKSPKLVLSKRPLIGGEPQLSISSSSNSNDVDGDGNDDYIPLVRDLKKRYGAPVVHYTARASQFVVNGLPLLIDQRKRPLYVIFDTGVSGMVVSQDLFDGRYLQARKNREKSLWGRVEVTFRTDSGREVVLSADQPITTPLGKAAPWKGFRGNLVVVGLAFLDGLSMSVDIDDGKIRFVD
uniref:Peptidase A1 domain-containing protein n=1 Tax=Pseudo-nitzschia australis TaxID=44445 RepID=A0A7S4ADL4_9STRA|mmetsp:Transcript_8274/g.17869  ORF Transcript_8274/g.17869 Transcript_8274/m.17869 type:complete len:519 (+) Transcript_8274:249-1805(+)